MTEATALSEAEQDASRVKGLIARGALPEQITDLVLRITLLKIDRTRTEGASQAARSVDLRSVTGTTFSEILTSRASSLVIAALPSLPPEDQRALLLWLAGTLEGAKGRDPDLLEPAGFLYPILLDVHESSGASCVANLQKLSSNHARRLEIQDRVLFGQQIKTLGPTRRRIIEGMLREADQTNQEGAGERARDLVLQARKLALSFLKKTPNMNRRR